MASPATWTWDEDREEWYYWNARNSSFVYESGGVVPYQQEDSERGNDETPRSLTSILDETWPQDPEYEPEGIDDPLVVANIEQGPADEITEPTALIEGIRSFRRLRGSRGDREHLDPRYMIRRPGYGFFKVGKVFKCLWPEPTTMPDNNNTVVTGPMGERIYAKIRWFVVIREGRNACTCLSIQTYQNQGVAKTGVLKSEHSIVHTIDQYPQSTNLERPRRNEEGMLTPISVVPTDEVERRMDPMSRVNYGKPYTVEHNVKVFDFGQVHDDSISIMRRNFLGVWQLQEQSESVSYLPVGTNAYDYAPYATAYGH
ncbi:hypothetical protein K490DRAFT_57161 [Saccharata proteae CBS 121410]|uniref:DUF6590 domain-containing protein n=1 Tax=Saccharata proteae CBS 121410 TaxID=1314787 RepID=A0A9P4LWZ5_9PEZI|nr:hypothetical protein K490DRAFT_57161 [Saccharata proteae CBS 121410]